MNMQGTPKMCMDASIDQDFKAVLSHILRMCPEALLLRRVSNPLSFMRERVW